MFVAADGGSGGGSLLPLILLVGLFALMYFMVIRPQSQRRKQMQAMQATLGVGSEVVTIGGLYGTVVDSDDETVTLEVSPDVYNRYAKGAVAKVLTSGAPAEESIEDEVDTEPAAGPVTVVVDERLEPGEVVVETPDKTTSHKVAAEDAKPADDESDTKPVEVSDPTSENYNKRR